MSITLKLVPLKLSWWLKIKGREKKFRPGKRQEILNYWRERATMISHAINEDMRRMFFREGFSSMSTIIIQNYESRNTRNLSFSQQKMHNLTSKKHSDLLVKLHDKWLAPKLARQKIILSPNLQQQPSNLSKNSTHNIRVDSINIFIGYECLMTILQCLR